MFQSGYNGATKVDSDPLNQNGEVTMSNNSDTKLEVMQVQVDSNEKVINAGLASHKAELEGYKLNVDGRFEATLNRMDADRKVADAKHDAALKRMDAYQKVADANHKAAFERMDADRKVADANHKAAFERMNANQKIADAKHEAAMERMDANHKDAMAQIVANQKVADAKHEAAMERIDGNQRAIETEFKAVRNEIKASAVSIKLWVIITLISTFAGGAGLVAAGIAIYRALSGN